MTNSAATIIKYLNSAYKCMPAKVQLGVKLASVVGLSAAAHVMTEITKYGNPDYLLDL